ncbi:hypothetical protein [Kribbella sp. NPDC000426]|uniref:hypothetical protein n=1 Tax=Kribbella sp. NPDC000426 TaxID=3154255 RepID=UPI00332DD60C
MRVELGPVSVCAEQVEVGGQIGIVAGGVAQDDTPYDARPDRTKLFPAERPGQGVQLVANDLEHLVPVSMDRLVGAESVFVELAPLGAQRRIGHEHRVGLEVPQRTGPVGGCRGKGLGCLGEQATYVVGGEHEPDRPAGESGAAKDYRRTCCGTCAPDAARGRRRETRSASTPTAGRRSLAPRATSGRKMSPTARPVSSGEAVGNSSGMSFGCPRMRHSNTRECVRRGTGSCCWPC